MLDALRAFSNGVAWRTSVRVLVLALLSSPGRSWGHGGGAMPEANVQSRYETSPEADRQRKLESVQAKIDRVEKSLESTALSAKKRAKLQQKLERLYLRKNELLDSK